MPGPGEYRPDRSEGITRVEDLPKPKIRCQSRNYRRRPCPCCSQSASRDRRRTENRPCQVTSMRDVIVPHKDERGTPGRRPSFRGREDGTGREASRFHASR